MRSFRSLFVLGAVAIVAAACSETPTQTEAPLAGIATFDQVEGDIPTYVSVCKIALDDATLGEEFSFEVSATDGDVPSSEVSMPAQDLGNLDADECREVWRHPGISFDDETEVTVTEIVPDGFALEQITFQGGDRDGETIESPESSTVTVVPHGGTLIYFKNIQVDTPGGGQGCTPGYWRQEHHYDNWTGYAPSDLFSDVFGVGPAIALGEAVELGGGGENALIRHAVAALLNAASPDVDYGFTEAEVINMVQDAYEIGEFEGVKDTFEEQNELGCDLD